MSSAFTCTAVHDGLSIKILSVCRRCGACQVVSILDGSLRQWEQSHQCGSERKSPQPAELPGQRAREG